MRMKKGKGRRTGVGPKGSRWPAKIVDAHFASSPPLHSEPCGLAVFHDAGPAPRSAQRPGGAAAARGCWSADTASARQRR